MPKNLDPKKEEYALVLLKKGESIRMIREKLTDVFGSAISPNKLLLLKKDLVIKEEESWAELLKPSSIDSEINERIIDTIKENSIVIKHFWTKLDKINDLLGQMTRILQEIQEKQVETSVPELKAKVSNYLQANAPKSLEQISIVTNINIDLTSMILNELEKVTIIEQLDNGLYKYKES